MKDNMPPPGDRGGVRRGTVPFGSRVNGEATETSDIDIAYDDSNLMDDSIIQKEVKALDTLIKVDVYLDMVVKRFEFAYEMSWKALKRYLGYS